jgi:starvation-inducible DNA-binding protein
MEELIQATKILLANHYSFYLKVHYYHWNVTGPNFPQYHEFLENIYTEVYGVVDKIAEEIRAMGGYAPGSFQRFIQLSQIQGDDSIPAPEEMLRRLLNDIDTMQASIDRVYNLAEQQGEHGLSNFVAERQDAFRKHAWMIRSTVS